MGDKNGYKCRNGDLRVFEQEIKHWLNEFSLKEWASTIDWAYDEIVGFFGSMPDACVFFDKGARNVNYYLSKFITKPPTEYVIRQMAFHEVCHHLLFGVSHHLDAKTRKQRITFTGAEHGIVRILENTLFERRWKELISKRKNRA